MTNDRNPLFPVFLKLETLNVLLIGGGNVALEKLGAILESSPEVPLTLVAETIFPEVKALLKARGLSFSERRFTSSDLDGVRFAFVAVNDPATSKEIADACRSRNIPVNVADQPALCDFYLGSVVTKGHLKLGISTNGKSPTVAKRIRENLDVAIPAEIGELLEHMTQIRSVLPADFAEKVKALNELTAKLIPSTIPGK